MKILVLESSGNIKGSSNMLADEFIRGAEESGHEITVFNAIRKNIKPCQGCGHCGMSGPCVLQDDYEKEIKPAIIAADMIVFVMPVYYYSWPTPLKVCVDRFYSFNEDLASMHKKTVLLSVAWDDTDTVFEVTEAFYKQLCSYMNFEDCGIVFGRGCGTPSKTRDSKYPELAYQLGKCV
jgi:multimeric flavodoxin WrbA